MVTSFGFSMLECGEYVQAVQRIRPDIALGMGDVLYGHQPGLRRTERMGDRTQSWLNALIAGMSDPKDGTPNTALFAPVLPLEAEKQTWYLAALQKDFQYHVSGLILYEIESIQVVPSSLLQLPRLWLGEVKGPHQLLDLISAGLDILTVPFLNETSDAGIALNFSFGGPEVSSKVAPTPLGLDMWSSAFATELAPLREDCKCYACANHHRAFIHHLLSAKEMLSWVLLQLHNYQTMNEFFAAVRRSIERKTYEADKVAFNSNFDRFLPAKTGQGPR